MAEQDRAKLYDDLHREQLAGDERRNRTAAEKILSIVFEQLAPASLLDVGCGLGTWLSVARDKGVREIRGLEGDWLDPARLQVDPACVSRCDLEAGFSLDRRFDLVVSLEVAEHLSEAAAAGFIASLVAHGDVILFSAAIPHQGGVHHVNERFPDYWAARFARHGFEPLDFLRARIWKDGEVHWWLRQNVMVFAHRDAIAANPNLRREAELARARGPLSVVHPEFYIARLQQAVRRAEEAEKLIALLARGGTFSTEVQSDGKLSIRRLGEPQAKDP